jgi:hypothetical protein
MHTIHSTRDTIAYSIKTVPDEYLLPYNEEQEADGKADGHSCSSILQ